MRKLISAGRKAVLVGLAGAMAPWAVGSAHVIVFGLYVTFVLYPELSPRRWGWVRELLMPYLVEAYTARRRQVRESCKPTLSRGRVGDFVSDPRSRIRTYVREPSEMSELRSVVEMLRSEALPDLPDVRIEEDFGAPASSGAAGGRTAASPRGDRPAAAVRARRPPLGRVMAGVHVQGGVGNSPGAPADRSGPRGHAADSPGGRRRRALDVSGASSRRDAASRPSAFGRCQKKLVEAARIHSIQDPQRVAAYWRQAVEIERSLEGDEKIRARRRLHASVSFLGMVRMDGDLDPETGETLLTALRAVLDAESRSGGGDDRTPAQRRADAPGEICRQRLDLAERPTVAGERPHVTVTVDADALQNRNHPEPGKSSTRLAEAPSSGDPWTISELDHVGPVNPEATRRFGCDAAIMRVVMAGRSTPLDVGRRTPVVSPVMRRAVIVRDRHCRFPGCDRPHTWCDAHHVVHWADASPTALPNLVLLCRRHHRMVHERGGFRLELLDGRPVFGRPDGSVLEDRAPP